MTDAPMNPTTAPAAPAAFPAPGLPGWGAASAPAVPATRKSSKTIITAAVAGVAVLGGLMSLVNLGQDDPTPTTDINALTNGIVVAEAPVTQPPVTVPPLGPTVPDQIVPTTVPISPPSTISPVEVDEGRTDGGVTQLGGMVAITDQIGTVIPDGWDLVDGGSDGAEGYAVIQTPGATFSIHVQRWDGDASALSDAWINDQMRYVDSVVAAGQDGQIPSASVVSAWTAEYEGVMADPQGSIPVEAVVLTYITQDGIGVVLETFNAIGDWDSHVSDYVAMRDAVIATL